MSYRTKVEVVLCLVTDYTDRTRKDKKEVIIHLRLNRKGCRFLLFLNVDYTDRTKEVFV